MKRPEIAGDRMVGLFLLGALAFNAPILSVFSADAFIAGIPVLYVYLFVTWAALIALMALTARRSGRAGAPRPPPRRDPASGGKEG